MMTQLTYTDWDDNIKSDMRLSLESGNVFVFVNRAVLLSHIILGHAMSMLSEGRMQMLNA